MFESLFKGINMEDIIGYIIMLITLVILIYFMINFTLMKKKECKQMNSLYPTLNNHLRPIHNLDPLCRNKLCQYYIKTAFNACSGGKYKNDNVDICNLIAIIKQGVRCLDFEIYSKDDKPVVATSTSNNFHVKETYDSVPFSTVMSTINNYAFASGTCPNYTDPLIIHLRIKSANQNIYSNMASIFQSYSNRMLGTGYNFDSSSNALANAPILSLRNKIIIIVDKSNDDFMDNPKFLEFVNMASNSINMRAYEYKTIKDGDNTELASYNNTHLTIVIPDKGANPENPDAQICRNNGVQMVAMIFQQSDEPLKESNLFFDKAGYAFAYKQA